MRTGVSSIKTRLVILMITMALAIAIAVSAVHLNGLVNTWLDGVKERVELTAQQVRTTLTQRLSQQTEEEGITAEEAKRRWYAAVTADTDLQQLLERSMAQSSAILEISIADENGVILNSSNNSRVGAKQVDNPPLDSLLAMGPIGRFWTTLRKRVEYQYRLPLGIPGSPKPVFQVEVLVSSVLLQAAVAPHMIGIATVSALAVLVAIALSLLAANMALAPMQQVDRALDDIAEGMPAVVRDPGTTTKEFAVVQSKLTLLGEQFRGAQQLLQKLEDAILLFDSDENLILAGEPAHRLLGFSRSDLKGKSLRDLFPPATELGAALRNAIHLQLPFEKRPFTWDRRGQAPMRLSVTVELLPGSGRNARSGALVSIRDAEGRKQVQSQLDLSERLTAIGRLTGGVAHEIKNPLNAIALRLEVLRAKLNDQVEGGSEEIDIIASEVTRLDRVVKTFLDFNRPVTLNLVDVDVVDLVTEIVTFVRPEAEAVHVQINQVAEPGPFLMHADRDLLKQAMLNVLKNGVEAMSASGGVMRVKVERPFTTSRGGGQCIVSFSDSGPGIPEGNRDKIFQLYFSTKTKGSGIGLAMAYRVAQLHGGKIDFTSEPGKGTTFLFVLPLLENRGETVPA
ncbi:MAG: PAS domain S-box protein [Acidobacteria bacterium]|nr:PAS domain S-box protein [Acidobacteriota bacterium]